MDPTDASASVTSGAGGFSAATVRKLAERAKVLIAEASVEWAQNHLQDQDEQHESKD